MQSFLDAILYEQNQLERMIQSLEEKKDHYPKGNLRASLHGSHYEYYLYEQEKKEKFPYGRYLGKEEKNLITELAQKGYEKEVLSIAIRQKEEIKKLLHEYDPLQIHKAYDDLPAARKRLVTPLTYVKEEYLESWEKEPYIQKPYDSREKGFYTIKDEHVRSKSEQSIANKYYIEGIPYRYEQQLILPDGETVYPDFAVLNVRTGKVFYHEHLGKMGDEEYAGNAIWKQERYMKNGYFPGDKLLITAETRENPFDIRVMDKLIEKYLR